MIGWGDAEGDDDAGEGEGVGDPGGGDDGGEGEGGRGLPRCCAAPLVRLETGAELILKIKEQEKI